MYLKSALKGDLSLVDYIRTLKYYRGFDKLHPEYFHPDGTIVFCGAQGSGKTLSAVRYVLKVLEAYPKATLISNVDIKGVPYFPFIGLEESLDEYPSNGEFGTVMLIDEIQVEFSSLESKNIAPSKLAIISQQRKRRIHIVGTSQLFTRISKAFREQIRCAVDCSTLPLFKHIQDNRIIDFDRCAYDINGNLTETAYKGRFLWTRKPELFEAYDTTQIIERKGDNTINERCRLVRPNAH